MATLTSHNDAPMRYLSKGPEFFRSTSLTSQNSDRRRLTAAERLEADKLKYVKSSQVRQRRATCDFYSSMISQSQGSTGTVSSGCVSSESPVHDENDVIDNSVNNFKEKNSSRLIDDPVMNRSITDVNVASKLRHSGVPRTRRPRPRSSTAHGAVLWIRPKTDVAEERGGGSNSKNVADVNDLPHDQCRKSRSVQSNSSGQQRSSSVGPVTPRRRSGAHQEEASVMSPRSQLRQARQNLKKVKTTNENQTIGSRARRPTADLSTCDVSDATIANNKETVKLRHSSNRKPRPFSVIENINRFELSANLVGKEKSNFNFQTNKSTKDAEDCVNPSGNIRSVVLSSKQSDRFFKRRSLDLSHAIDTCLHLPLSERAPLQIPIRSPDSDKTLTNPQHGIQSVPKPWIRSGNSSRNCESDSKRPHRNSYHEESNQNHSSSGHNLSQALDKIINYPDREDDMDTAYSSMSPDASTDSKTLMVRSSPEVKPNSIAANINNALNGRVVEVEHAGPRDQPGTVAKQSSSENPSLSTTCKENTNFNAKSSHDQIEQPNQESFRTVMSRKSITGTKNSPREETRSHPKWANASTTSSQPFNRIDLAPCSSCTYQKLPTKGPMFAPSIRKEVVPDYYSSGNPAIINRAGVDRNGNVNTMKSQTTASSTSGDTNKPLIDTTASDLKPWRGRRSSAPQSVPIKPTVSYSPNTKACSKRVNNGTLSPTNLPIKQAARNSHPVSARSSSSTTPLSSLKRNPVSSRSSSLKRNRPRSKSDVSNMNGELDRFFATMGMDETFFSLFPPHHTPGLHVSSESDFSFAGASAYVRDGPDEVMEVDPATAALANSPAVSVIEKNARVMRWIMSCKRSMNPSKPKTGRHHPTSPTVPPKPCTYTKNDRVFQNYPPPVPPRSYRTIQGVPIESDV